MARIFTTPEAEQVAKSWLHDITLMGGLRTSDQRTNGRSSSQSSSSYIKAAKEICDELINRDFNSIDSSINSAARAYFKASLTDSRAKWKTYKPEAAAKAIVYMAELLQLYWDDTVRTPYEIDEFKKTLLGAAVYRYGRYLSAISKKAPKSTSTRTPGQAPKNGYKASGSQLNKVRDLIDLPGEPGSAGTRLQADTEWIYYIKGKLDNSKNAAIVHIKPLSNNSKYAVGNTNKVCISSGNGYTDCTCFFDNPNDAQAFLNAINNANAVPLNVSGLQVVKNKADKIQVDANGNATGGYFMVGTEFGPCVIKAATLNESFENIEETEERVVNWEKATEGYSREELNELHTWMRRD